MTPEVSVSIVVPLYNEAENLDALTDRIAALIEAQPEYGWEVLYVNDGSRDGSGARLRELAEQHDWLSVIHLSRNFGHQIAITAGIDHARGEAVVLMDGDLQDPPELIPEMLTRWKDGYDVVYATRSERKGENWFKLLSARLFYRFLQSLTEVPIPLDTGDFRLMSRPVADALCAMRERNRFVRGMVSWVGYRQTPIYYERSPRHEGETKYSVLHMARFATDGILSFSRVPLRWITTLGFVISLSSFMLIPMVIYIKFKKYLVIADGWSSLMVAILMLGGIQLICLGMLGEYIGRIFDEVQDRPLYLVRGIDGKAD